MTTVKPLSEYNVESRSIQLMEWDDCKAVDFVKKIHSIINEIGDPDAYLCLDLSSDDSNFSYLTIIGYTEKTEEEKEDYIKLQKSLEERQKERDEKTYERLKKKWGFD